MNKSGRWETGVKKSRRRLGVKNQGGEIRHHVLVQSSELGQRKKCKVARLHDSVLVTGWLMSNRRDNYRISFEITTCLV